MATAERLPAPSTVADHREVDVEVEVGGWEHECCGKAIERDQLVDLGITRTTTADGQERLVQTNHHLETAQWVHGRVREIQVLRAGQPTRPIHRLPSGEALRGLDPDDDGHLETFRTAKPLPRSNTFLVLIRPSR